MRHTDYTVTQPHVVAHGGVAVDKRECSECGDYYAETEKVCPYCGAKNQEYRAPVLEPMSPAPPTVPLPKPTNQPDSITVTVVHDGERTGTERSAGPLLDNTAEPIQADQPAVSNAQCRSDTLAKPSLGGWVVFAILSVLFTFWFLSNNEDGTGLAQDPHYQSICGYIKPGVEVYGRSQSSYYYIGQIVALDSTQGGWYKDLVLIEYPDGHIEPKERSALLGWGYIRKDDPNK